MTNPIKAATVIRSFGANMTPRFVVIIDYNAAEIMGETKLRYVFEREHAANGFANMLQDNLDAAYEDAAGVN